MKRYVLLLLLLGLLSSCSGLKSFLWLSDRPTAGSTEADETALQPPDTDIPVYLTPEERFEEALFYYEAALDSATAQRNIAAQNLFESAIVKMGLLAADSLDINQEDFQRVHSELIADYAKFLNQLPVLPAESSPSAVYLSLSEFLGDTVESWEDLIDIVLAPVDTSAAFYTESGNRIYPPVPLMVNAYVEEALLFFQTKARKVFGRWLERSEEAVPYFTALLREEGMPEEIVYLAMIESGFSNIAYSRAAASGPWQFISSTGKIYGLEVGKYYDERRDPELSTHAACRYLRKLHNQFGDWYLAFAAYNCGEMNVVRAQKRSGLNEYWQIRSYLPRQTRDYVPYYLAARIICQDPAKYGFTPPSFRPLPPTGIVYVNGSMDLRVIAKCAETDHETIKMLNPALKKGITPPNARNFPVRVPANTGQNFTDKLSQIPVKEREAKPEKSEKSDWVRHRVRSGETISTIARKYGVTEEAITSIPANRVKNPHRISAGHYLLIPVRRDYTPSSEEPEVGTPQPPQVTSSDGADRTIYTVRRGDTIGQIAGRHRVMVSDLKTWNHLWGERYIFPGQKLIVWTKTGADKSSTDRNLAIQSSRSKRSTSALGVHLVQPGDTLWDIAKRYGVSVQELKRWNGIRSAYRLQVGDEIKLSP